MSKRTAKQTTVFIVAAVLFTWYLAICQDTPRTPIANERPSEDEIARRDIRSHCDIVVPDGWETLAEDTPHRRSLERHDLPVKVILICDWADSEAARVLHHAFHRALTEDGATLMEDVVSTAGWRRIVGLREPEDEYERKVVELIDPLGPDTYRVRLMQGEWPDDEGAASEEAFDAFVEAVTEVR